MNIKQNHPLSKETTLKVGGPAEFFCKVTDSDEAIKALKRAEDEDREVVVLGRGSNVVVSPQGLSGLTVKLADGEIEVLEKKEGSWKIKVGAGVFLPDLSEWATENSLTGLEWAGGVPGSLGGAIYGNAGAFGRSIADDLKEVEVFKDGKKEKISAKKLEFGYRSSTFKEEKRIVLTAVLELQKGKKEEITEKTKSYLNYRKENHPIDKPTAGSTFRNPTGEPKQESLRGRPLLKKFAEEGEIPAGYLIEEAGLKGELIGGAKFSEVHANFLINTGKASAGDARKLIEKAKKKVKKEFGFDLEREVRYLPEDL